MKLSIAIALIIFGAILIGYEIMSGEKSQSVFFLGSISLLVGFSGIRKKNENHNFVPRIYRS